jgi:N-acetylglutamate synthase-like GNAT family acetyltransferase
MESQVTISRADSSALEEILSLLNTVDLPPDGVAEHLGGFLVARNETGRLVGCAGMERHGELGLLRSVAVTLELQRSGLGSRLVEAILQDASRQGISEALLLTTTARDFFKKKFGFVVADREDYEDRLAQSVEWRLPRCSLAVLMKVEI